MTHSNKKIDQEVRNYGGSEYGLVNANAEPNSKRLLLSDLRGGDYAHAGDVEAIDLVLDKILKINPKVKSGNVLDVGCGFGGTLEYLRNQGFTNLYGVDINAESINYAKTKYQNIHFDLLDALEIESFYPKEKFDLVIMFNSIYAITDKKKLLESLAKISKKDAILVVFDYSSPKQNKALPILDFSGKKMLPIELKSFSTDLKETNWHLIEAKDLSNEFITWYSKFIDRLRNKKNYLEQNFSKNDINQVESSFSYFLNQLKNKNMEGVVIYATKYK